MNRRDFLKFALGSVAACVLPALPVQPHEVVVEQREIEAGYLCRGARSQKPFLSKAVLESNLRSWLNKRLNGVPIDPARLRFYGPKIQDYGCVMEEAIEYRIDGLRLRVVPDGTLEPVFPDADRDMEDEK